MQVIPHIHDMQTLARLWLANRRRVGLVPTMGALHDGHLALIKQAVRQCEVVVVSIFVNPTQFGPKEDFAAYPRTFEADAALCKAAGVDVIFAPTAAEMYPADSSTWINEEDVSRRLEGERRPGHFRGVATVVAKLFLAVQPEVAIFGQKDAQQVLVIKRMVRDLNFPVQIVVHPIVREADGLAMSSRNRYLSPAHRSAATAIHRGLTRAAAARNQGERDAEKLVAIVRAEISASGGEIDYIACVHAETMAPLTGHIPPREVLLAVVAKYGGTRLLDNVVLPVREA